MEAATSQQRATTRMYQSEDYDLLASWWTQQKWTPVPKDMLPDLGLISIIDGKEICAGFLYTSNSPTMWMEWVIADPNSDKAVRSEALEQLIDNLLTLAKFKGAKYIVTSVLHPKLIERLEEKGFTKTDQQMTNMIKVIRGN